MIDLDNFSKYYDSLLEGKTTGYVPAFKGKNALPSISKLLAETKYLKYDRENCGFLILESIEMLKEKNYPLYQALYCVTMTYNAYDARKRFSGPGCMRRYGELVPFYLSAYKEHMNIPYNMWIRHSSETDIMRLAYGKDLWDQIFRANPDQLNKGQVGGEKVYRYYDYQVADWSHFEELKKAYLSEITTELTEKPNKGLRYSIEEYDEITGEDGYNDSTDTGVIRSNHSCKVLHSATLAKIYEAHPRVRTPYTILNFKFGNHDHDELCIPLDYLYDYQTKNEELFMF